MKGFLFVLLWVLFAAANAEAVTRYVRNGAGGGCVNGSTNYIPVSNTCAGGGTATVYTTIQSGVNVTSAAGDALFIRAGTYVESVELDSLPSSGGGSYATAITIGGYSGEMPIIQPNGSSPAIHNDTRQWIILRDLIIDGRNIAGNGVHNMQQNAPNVRFVNVETRNNGLNIPTKEPAAGIIIQANNVEWIGGSSHHNGSAANSYKFTGLQSPYGFYWNGSNGKLTGAAIYENGCLGIQVYGTNNPTNVELSDNIWYGNGHNCYYDNGSVNPNGVQLVVQGNGHQVFNNLVYASGIRQVNGIAPGYGSGQAYYNNTIYGFTNAGFSDWTGNLTSSTFRNNIIANSGVAAFESPSGTGNTFANNLCTSSTTGCNSSLTDTAANTFITPGTDFHLKAASRAINPLPALTGCPPTDLAGTARPQGSSCDVGAYEFGAPATPPVDLVLALGFDEGSGTSVTDISGRNNNGTFSTGVSWAGPGAGKYGNALSFAGTGGVTISNSSSLNLSTGITLMAWVKPTSVATDAAIISQGQSVYYLFGSLDYCGTDNVVGGISAGRYACYGPSLSTAGVWQHVAVTYSQAVGQILIYLNGVNVTSASATGSIGSDANPLKIGTSFYNEHFSGDIDEVRIYDGAIDQDAGYGVNGCLSAASIIRDMNCSINPITGPPASASGFKVGTAGSKIIGVGGSYKTGN